ncbi:M56 family metallopeptidase [Parapedobacter indicus]|uniref:BlaR1 peptidase M56 n=1 Tax=Parapedobacter indicus TaxID=1477437 RepID=A0A1I3D7G4_9SPHI|nr:M56 family metallopeptidase [Parapedobacter indicus]PPL04557.1 BlaR1 peptidase M56 [Parapedobacter indicus]SFH82670.1 BlaR1 peptidase M56 [Parapedobacter indicus]
MTFSLDNLVEAMGWSIIHSLWIGALAYGLLLLLFAAFPETRARTRHAMAFSSLILLFAGFLAVFLDKLDISFGSAGMHGTSVDFPLTMLVFLEAKPPAVPFFNYLVGGYFAGFCLQTLLLALGYVRVYRLRSSGLLPVPKEWEEVFAQTLLRMDMNRRVGFWLSGKIKTPLVVGYLKPVVLFPLAAANQLDLDQVEAILIHELSHVRRNDYLLNLFKTVIEAVLFFNPFVWLLGRIVNEERENACDDDVLEQIGKPIFYAQTLLRVAALANGADHKLAMTAVCKKPSQLFQRIKRITAMKTNYRNVRQQIWVLAFALLASASLAWIGPKEKVNTSISRNPDANGLAEHDNQQAVLDTTRTIRFDKAQVDTSRNDVKPVVKDQMDYVESFEIAMDTTVFKARPKMVYINGDTIQLTSDTIMVQLNRSKPFPEDLAFFYPFNADSPQVLQRKAFKLDSLNKTVQEALAKSMKAINMDSLNRMIAKRVAWNDSITVRIDSIFKSKEFVFLPNLSFNIDSLVAFTPHVKEWELYQSPEYKALREDFEKKVEKLRRKREGPH